MRKVYSKGWPTTAELLSHCLQNNGCLEWKYARDKRGYGQLRRANKLYYCTRIMMINKLKLVNFPSKLFVLHKCDNPPCINPVHLEIGNVKTNAQDRVKRSRQYCGERHHKSYLTPLLLKQIIELHLAGFKPTAIARKLNLPNRNAIKAFIAGKTWKNYKITEHNAH